MPPRSTTDDQARPTEMALPRYQRSGYPGEAPAPKAQERVVPMPRGQPAPPRHAAKCSSPGRHGAGTGVGRNGFADKTGGTGAAIFGMTSFFVCLANHRFRLVVKIRERGHDPLIENRHIHVQARDVLTEEKFRLEAWDDVQRLTLSTAACRSMTPSHPRFIESPIWRQVLTRTQENIARRPFAAEAIRAIADHAKEID